MIEKLGNIATYLNGYAFKPCDWSESGLPIIRIQDLTGTSAKPNYYEKTYDKKYEINEGDVLISWSASLGVYVWHGRKALLNQHIFKVIFDKIVVDKDFFVYQIEYILKKATALVHGATMQHLTRPVFNNLPFKLFPIERQQKIALTLNTISTLINDRQKQLQYLDGLIKSRFVEMFGDPLLNPKHWNIEFIKDVVTDVQYGTSKPSIDGGRFKYLRMNNLTSNGRIDLSNLKYIDIPDPELEKCLVKKGDILFNRTNSIDLVGKTALFNYDEPMVIAGYIIRVRLKNETLPEFFTVFMNLPYMKQKLRQIAKGAVNQANINSQELQALQIYEPPLFLQNQFADFVQQVDKSRLAVQKSLDELDLLKKSLMQEYFG